MITSTTELLNDIVKVTSDGKLLSKTSQASPASQQSRKDFTIRYGCMQSWFLRSSWLEKMKWLTQLLEGLSSIDSLSLILNTLRVTCSKSTVYAGSQYSTNFVYDKALQDHNRSIQKQALTDAQEADIKWFKTLDNSEQILMLIGLIRLGGGSIMHQIYERAVKLYHHKVEEAEEAQRNGVFQIKPETLRNYTSNYEIPAPRRSKSPSVGGQLPTFPPRIFNIKPDNENEFEKYDPKDPFVIEVEKQKKFWNDTITKYRIQVEGKPSNVTKGKTKKDSPKKSKNDTKSLKSTKSTKSDKKGKKREKDKGKGGDEAIDQIQLLPIWVVKKIFCYLDAKTLNKVKTVNKYWAYAITDLQKEQKARKYLDKFIQKMEASVLSSQTHLEEISQELKEAYDTSNPKKRLLKLAERGATLSKLKGKLKEPLTDKCLVEDAAELTPDRYILPVNHVKAFPRSVARGGNLYKIPSCMINELGFTKLHLEQAAGEDGFRPIYTTKTNDNVSHHSVQVAGRSSEEGLNVVP